MVDLEEWLDSIGLGHHAALLRENDIDADLLGELTGEDLKELGLSLGDRKRLLRAIAALGASEAAPAEVHAPHPDHPHPAERRRLTVMFVDLVGSTALSSRLDPEELSEVIRAYQDVVAGIATRYGGHVAQYLGDGCLCYFGWPRALEDAAVQAVEAALEIVEAVRRLATLGEALSCRVGIATGLVVVGDLIGTGDRDNTAIGDTPNFAARLQEFAASGQIVISDSTRKLLGRSFRLESLGMKHLKGLPGQHEIFAVTASEDVEDRFTARSGSTMGEMVGREQELGLLTERWRLSAKGEGQAVLLVGEAGIGKSRICRALFDALQNETVRRARLQCSPHHRDTALWPVIHTLASRARLLEARDGEDRLDRFEAVIREAGDPGPRMLALLAELMGLDGSHRYGPVDLPPSARREALLTGLANYFVGLATGRPLLMLVEDAHWCDPTTLELLDLLIDRIGSEPLMLLATSRPENEPVLPARPHVTGLTLNRLSREGVEAIVRRLGGHKLSAGAIDAIVERTDGVPLFVEELTKALIESGDQTVPASLHDVLMARLDRLPEVKEIAQIASVIGREFESDPLAQVAKLSRETVLKSLDDLQQVELVFRRGSDTGRYLFKHALVRDAAYESLLNRRRQEIHSRIFDILKENPTTSPGVLANHAAEAGRRAEAVEYGRRAAVEALSRPAYAEALTHLETALGVLSLEEASEEVQRKRLELLLLAGEARIAHYGYAAEATVATYREVEEIARSIGDREKLLRGLYGRWAGHYVPGELAVALDVADRICEVAEHLDDDLPRALGHRLRGTCLTMMGRTEPATDALATAERYYDPERHAAQAGRFAQDVGVARECYLAGVLTLEGRYDAARALAREVLEHLDAVGHAHTAGYGSGHLALFLCAADIQPLGQEIAERCIEMSTVNRMPLWEALGRASYSMAQVQAGGAAEVVQPFADALATLARLRFDVFRPILLPSQALALARAGDFAAAAAHIAEARALVEDYEARYAEPEILRAEGQLALMQRNHIKAKACFEHALGRARNLGHRSWELRAAADLAELLSWQEEKAEARALLASVYGGFSEGHDLPAMRKVAKFIDEMA